MPSITATGIAYPTAVYSQDEVYHGLKTRRIYLDLFTSSGITGRHLCVSPFDLPKTTAQDMHDSYRQWALELAKRSVIACLAKKGVSPRDVDMLVYVSCTGSFESPAMSFEIAHDLGMREDIIHRNLAGHGCEGAIPGLRDAWEHSRLYPLSKIICCTTEISHAAYHPDVDVSTGIGNAIFCDGAASYLIEDKGQTGLRM